MRPLDARLVWCGASISSDQAMMVSTMLWNSQVFAGGVEVAEPVEGFQGAGFVVGEVEAVELLEGLVAGFESGVFRQQLVEAGLVRVGERVASPQQQEPGFEHLRVVCGSGAAGFAALNVAAHRGETGTEPSDGCGTGRARSGRGADRSAPRSCRLATRR